MAKKSFKENPALQFISRPAQEADTPEVPAPAPQSAPVKALYVETKSRRVQLLMQPSLHDKLKALAAARGVSLNELVHETLKDAVEG